MDYRVARKGVTMTNTNDKVSKGMEKMAELVASGMSQEEAMRAVLEEAVAKPASRVMIADRVTWISGLSNLAELEKAIRIAYAKKSKAKGKPETVAKYEAEIKAGQERKNTLLAELNAAEDKVAKAIELGMDPSKLLQDIIQDLETKVNDRILILGEAKSMTKKLQKELLNQQPSMMHPIIKEKLAELGGEFVDRYQERGDNGDNRVLSLNKKYNLIDVMETWTSEAPTEEKAPEESADETPSEETNADQGTTTEEPTPVIAPKGKNRKSKDGSENSTK